jgi:hypothetical protein
VIALQIADPSSRQTDVLSKRLFLQDTHSATSQKTALFRFQVLSSSNHVRLEAT